MAQPTKITTHGALPTARAVVDEAGGSVVLAVEEFTFEDSRQIEPVKDADMTTCRVKSLDPQAKMTLKGQAKGLTGLVAANTGSKLTSLANFAAAINGYDPADGSLIVISNKSQQGRIQDQVKVDIAVTHFPYVVDP